MMKKKKVKWSEDYDETKSQRVDIRITPTGREWLDEQNWVPATVFERLARGVWKLSGPDIQEEDEE